MHVAACHMLKHHVTSIQSACHKLLPHIINIHNLDLHALTVSHHGGLTCRLLFCCLHLLLL